MSVVSGGGGTQPDACNSLAPQNLLQLPHVYMFTGTPGEYLRVRRVPDRIGLLGKPPASSAFLPSREVAVLTFLRSPQANTGMKQYECGNTKPLLHVGHDHGKLAVKT